MPSGLEAVLMHAKKHVSYPATKKDLVEACNNASDVPIEDRKWFTSNLPEKTYNSASEVVEALLKKV
jgi:hypothetical protein